MRVGIGQINASDGDVRGNGERILRLLQEAATAGCELVVFPELAIPGPVPLDLVRQSGFVEACRGVVEDVAEASRGIAVIVGTIARTRAHGTEGRSNCAVLIEDGEVRAEIGKADPSCGGSWGHESSFAPAAGVETLPVGERTIGVTLGRSFDEPAIDVLATLGADWIIHLAGSPFHVGVQAARRERAARLARESRCGLLFVNGVGGHEGSVFDGGSFAVNAAGSVIAQAPRFEAGLTTFRLDAKAPVDVEDDVPDVETRKALVLGIRDYVRKNGFERVVVGVSGGIDSALVAALAVDALGPDGVIATYIPCACSSPEGRRDAGTLASNLGIELVEIPATGVHAALREALPFDSAGIVDENLQARARAVLWMALANERDALVLAAGNKSEAAVGYATLYGDTTGALEPIGDLYKEDVYRLARTFGNVIPESIHEKAPSAELRPGQRDEDDLPPYEILDPILRAWIDEDASRADLIRRGFDAQIIDDVLDRFHNSEFKRRQMPPAIAVTRTPLSVRRIPLVHEFRDN
jgi:NAD+ synthase (glutamine-hydrolysing)